MVVVVVLIEKPGGLDTEEEAGPRHMVEVYQPTVPLEGKESIS
jgi:hypothetical protein